VVKYRRLPRFDADYQRLSEVERQKFKEALAVFIAACREYEAQPKHYVWPASLRIEKLGGTPVMAMTWSFSGPDGRATFQFDTIDGEMCVVWRRVGRHRIYLEP
jgi:hypothetical protein